MASEKIKSITNLLKWIFAILILGIGISIFFYGEKWQGVIDMFTSKTEERKKLEKENKFLIEENSKIKKRMVERDEMIKSRDQKLDSLEREREEIDVVLSKQSKTIVITREKLWESINKQEREKEELRKIREKESNLSGNELIESIKIRLKNAKNRSSNIPPSIN